MFAITSIGFPLFALLLVPLWYRTAPARRWCVMLVASGVFYLSIDPPGLPLLAAATAVVWLAAKRLNPEPAGRAKPRFWLAVGLAAALGPLLALKYSGVVYAPFRGLWQPLGLAYFSLQLISYLVDVYRGQIGPEPRYSRLLCYAACFLSITQGPFSRYDQLMPQLAAPTTAFVPARFYSGAQRMAWGYFKKLAVADRASVVVAAVFAAPADFDRSQLLFVMALYVLQLYADFSGYTDIVLGTGEMLGLQLPENFRQPFFAVSIKDFWQRWHISLSAWLRDYVYIPLGGNRRGRLRKYGNLLATFLVSGAWHAGMLTYLVWGALHGVFQIIGDATAGLRGSVVRRFGWEHSRLRRAFRCLFVFFLVSVAFVFFRAPDLAAACRFLQGILCSPGHAVFSEYWRIGLISRLDLLLLLTGVAIVLAVELLHAKGVSLRRWVAARPRPVRWMLYEGAVFTFLLMGQFLSGGSFLYARF